MHPMFAEVARYLSTALGLDISPAAWQESDGLPHFLQEGYEYAEAKILGVAVLLALDSDRLEKPASVVRKHMEQVATKCGRNLVYVRPQISAYTRRRLVEHRIAFVVPGNQLYLPMLGIELLEHFRKIRSEPQAFSPSTQVALIHALLPGTNEVLTLQSLAARLHYSPMTITRVFDELEAAGIGEVSAAGRRRQFGLGEPNAVTWAKALPRLRDPVRRRIWAAGDRIPALGTTAGLSALAELSAIAAPPNRVFAMSSQNWRSLHEARETTELPRHDPDAHEIEIWRYAPELLAEHGMVDPLSLYLSLRNTSDERVESALQSVLEARGW
jgi:hypothetical protein